MKCSCWGKEPCYKILLYLTNNKVIAHTKNVSTDNKMDDSIIPLYYSKNLRSYNYYKASKNSFFLVWHIPRNHCNNCIGVYQINLRFSEQRTGCITPAWYLMEFHVYLFFYWCSTITIVLCLPSLREDYLEILFGSPSGYLNNS